MVIPSNELGLACKWWGFSLQSELPVRDFRRWRREINQKKLICKI